MRKFFNRISLFFYFMLDGLSDRQYFALGSMTCILLMFLGLYVLPRLIQKYFITV